MIEQGLSSSIHFTKEKKKVPRMVTKSHYRTQTERLFKNLKK